MPIKAINQFSTDWRIKARIVKKGMRHYVNARGEGDILNVELIDREGTQIAASMFNDYAFKYEPILKENKVYIFSGGQVKMANKRF